EPRHDVPPARRVLREAVEEHHRRAAALVADVEGEAAPAHASLHVTTVGDGGRYGEAMDGRQVTAQRRAPGTGRPLLLPLLAALVALAVVAGAALAGPWHVAEREVEL